MGEMDRRIGACLSKLARRPFGRDSAGSRGGFTNGRGAVEGLLSGIMGADRGVRGSENGQRRVPRACAGSGVAARIRGFGFPLGVESWTGF